MHNTVGSCFESLKSFLMPPPRVKADSSLNPEDELAGKIKLLISLSLGAFPRRFSVVLGSFEAGL